MIKQILYVIQVSHFSISGYTYTVHLPAYRTQRIFFHNTHGEHYLIHGFMAVSRTSKSIYPQTHWFHDPMEPTKFGILIKNKNKFTWTSFTNYNWLIRLKVDILLLYFSSLNFLCSITIILCFIRFSIYKYFCNLLRTLFYLI